MELPRFDYVCPGSVEEATRLLKSHGPRAQLAAGGTDLFPRMKQRLVRPELLVSLKGIPPRGPKVDHSGDLHLDPLISLAEMARSPLVQERTPLLAEAASSIGSNQIRHMATLGGNLCLETRCLYYNQTHTYQFVEPCLKRGGGRCYLVPKGKRCLAVFSADTVPALVSLGASIRLQTPDSSRQLPLEALYTGDGSRPLDLRGPEMITEVVIPRETSICGTAFVKFTLRGAIELAALNVAVVLAVGENRSLCRRARITVGAIWTAPLRMSRAEKAMRGKRLSAGLFQQAAEMVASQGRWSPSEEFSAAYLRECLRVQTLRALDVAAERASRPSEAERPE